MSQVIDNSYVEGAKTVDLLSKIQSKRWSTPSNGAKAFIPAIGISNDYNPRHSMVVSSAGDLTTITPTAETTTSERWWVTITDGDGNWAQGEVADIATPTPLALDTSGLNADKDWQTILRARKTGDEQDAVILWPIQNPASNPTVAIPAGYNN